MSQTKRTRPTRNQIRQRGRRRVRAAARRHLRRVELENRLRHRPKDQETTDGTD